MSMNPRETTEKIKQDYQNYVASILEVKDNEITKLSRQVVSEAGLETTYDFNSLDQFQEVYEKIIATRKVRFIISRLIRLMEEQDEQEAQNELLAQNESIESED